MTVIDLTGGGAPITLRFGYDTGLGGSIPPAYKATLGGIEKKFNPVEAVIDTTGGIVSAIDPKLPALSPASAAYEGPLTTFVQATTTGIDAKADFRFLPMPDKIELAYSDDPTGGHHATMRHSGGETDIAIDANAMLPGIQLDATARMDRLPRQVALDMTGKPDDGGVDVVTSAP